MRIVLMPSAFHPSLGGVEELSRQLGHELTRQGHQVLVITERWPRQLPAEEVFEGLPVRRFPMRVPTSSLKSKMSYFLTHRSILASIKADLTRFCPDVLHVQCVSSTTLYALESRKQLHIPLIVTLQGELTMDAQGIFQKPGIARQILQRAALEAEVVTGCSAKTLQDASDYLIHRDPALPTRVVFNAANLNDFENAPPRKNAGAYLFALGRLVPQKGFDNLLQAVAASEKLRKLDLLIAGDGPLKAELLALAQQLGLGDRVQFLGRTNREQTVALFLGCQAFVLPSRADEGLPVVCAEAMAAGKPIVATRSGGTPEMIEHEVNGLIVEKGDVGELRLALERITEDGIFAERLATTAKQRAHTFSWPEVTARYLDVYNIAIAAKNKRPL